MGLLWGRRRASALMLQKKHDGLTRRGRSPRGLLVSPSPSLPPSPSPPSSSSSSSSTCTPCLLYHPLLLDGVPRCACLRLLLHTPPLLRCSCGGAGLLERGRAELAPITLMVSERGVTPAGMDGKHEGKVTGSAGWSTQGTQRVRSPHKPNPLPFLPPPSFHHYPPLLLLHLLCAPLMVTD